MHLEIKIFMTNVSDDIYYSACICLIEIVYAAINEKCNYIINK